MDQTFEMSSEKPWMLLPNIYIDSANRRNLCISKQRDTFVGAFICNRKTYSILMCNIFKANAICFSTQQKSLRQTRQRLLSLKYIKLTARACEVNRL